MKKVLIVSPNFPPVNAADMHRVRQSLPYFRELGWEPVILAVDERYVEAYSLDPLLLHTIPPDIEIHKVGAWDVDRTRKFGLGSLSMRSYFYFQRKGDELLKSGQFDLVYFSTTAFHVMALGPRWKRKFGVPFILDIQDPWRSDFYLSRPKSERPPKFKLAYTIDKYLEGRTVPKADGIISVSEGYCETFLQRYPGMRKEQFRVIPFGASSYDFEVMKKYLPGQPDGGTGQPTVIIDRPPGRINVVYIGRGGHDLDFALEIIFKALAKGVAEEPALFSRLHCWFIGTSYTPAGTGRQTILPEAEKLGVGGQVTEIPDRLPYFETLSLLEKADILLVPGSTDTSYTASKIYPYVLTGKPLMAVFHRKSSVVRLLQDIGFGKLIVFDGPPEKPDDHVAECLNHFRRLLEEAGAVAAPAAAPGTPAGPAPYDRKAFEPYSARAMTIRQTDFFNQITAAYAP